MRPERAPVHAPAGWACLAALLLALSSAPASAQQAQPQALGHGMGVQVQSWYLQPGDLGLIVKAGFSVVRWGIPWEAIEKSPGIYDWSEADRFVRRLAASGLRSIVILGYGNRLYTHPDPVSSATTLNQLIETHAPVTAAARAAFARFAAAAAARYRDQQITWEIWNEPDNPPFWLPKPDPAAYAALALQTCSAIRAAAPHATVLAGAGAALPNAVSQHENIYAALVRSGALDCIDSLSSHAYRMSADYREPDPESIEIDDRASLAYLHDKLRVPAQKSWAITEWGFTSYTVSPDLQAAYLVRANLTNAAAGVPLTIWYEWRDSRPDASGPEAHFGLLTTQGGEKNRRGALALLSQIAGAHLIRRLPTDDTARVFLLQRDHAYFLVAWNRTSDETNRSALYVDGVRRADISYMPSVIAVTGSHIPSVHIG